jgi:hypothetical protein
MNQENKPNEVKMITLEELTNSVRNYSKVQELEDRIKKLEEVGDKMAGLLFQGTTSELKEVKWQWRELVPKKEELK